MKNNGMPASLAEHGKKNFRLSPELKRKIIISVLIFHFFAVLLPYLVSLIVKHLKPQREKVMTVKLMDNLPGQKQSISSSPDKTDIVEPVPPVKITNPIRQKITEPSLDNIIIAPQPLVDMAQIRNIKINDSKPQHDGIYQGEQTVTSPVIVDGGKNCDAADEEKYFAKVQTVLTSRWRQPSNIELSNRKPSVEVEIGIDDLGNVISYRVISPSGIRPMDNSVQEMLNSIKSLPRPPKAMVFTTKLCIED